MRKQITDREVCAARDLLRWTQKDLADKSGGHGVGVATIRRFERGATIGDETLEKIVATLVRAGVVFLGPSLIDDQKVVSGVALKASARPKPHFEKRSYPPKSTGGRQNKVEARAKTSRTTKPATRSADTALVARKRTTKKAVRPAAKAPPT